MIGLKIASNLYLLNFKIKNVKLEYQSMKSILQVSILSVLLALAYMQCQIPPNCEHYSVSQQKCLSCQPNYLLIANQCISTLSSAPTISGFNTNAASTQPQPIVLTQPQNRNIAQFTSHSVQPTSAQSSSLNSDLFNYWFSQQQKPSTIQTPQATQTQTQTQQTVQQQPQQQAQASFQQQFQSLIYGINGQAISQQSNVGTSNGNSLISNYVDYNCKVKDQGNSYCIQCYLSFYFNRTVTKCVPVNPLCKNTTSDNLCTSCYGGYNLVNNNCVVDNTYAGSSNSNSNSNGNSNGNGNGNKQGSNSDQLLCIQGFYFNTTLNKCLPYNQLCKTVTPNNKCTSCYTNYALNAISGDCILIPTTPLPAQVNQQTVSYPYVNISGLIYLINSRNEAVGPIPYPIPTGYSTPSVNTDPYCNAFNNGQCLACINRYYLTSSGCKMVDPNCQFWITNGLCTQCQNGYTVISDGSCQVVSASSTVSQPPLQPKSPCYQRQYLSNGSCVNVSDQCKTFELVNGTCLSCYQGYALASGACVLA